MKVLFEDNKNKMTDSKSCDRVIISQDKKVIFGFDAREKKQFEIKIENVIMILN
jgi:hypothetical protein